jgi:hypothetical protein
VFHAAYDDMVTRLQVSFKKSVERERDARRKDDIPRIAYIEKLCQSQTRVQDVAFDGISFLIVAATDVDAVMLKQCPHGVRDAGSFRKRRTALIEIDVLFCLHNLPAPSLLFKKQSL